MLFTVLFTALSVGLIPTASTQPLALPQASSFASIPSSSTPSCGFIGNPDIYGPGIRIGIYTQTIAVYLTKFFIPSQSPVIRDSLTVFTFALLIVAFVYVAQPSSNYAIELFMILQIMSWNCLTGVRAMNQHSRGVMQDRRIKVIGLEGMNIVALSLHAWFWWGGVDLMMERNEHTGCDDRVFFFANVELRGWFKVLMKIVAILGLCEHAHVLSLRGFERWACGAMGSKEVEVRRAIEEYNSWKRMNLMGRVTCVVPSPQSDDHTVKTERSDQRNGPVATTATEIMQAEDKGPTLKISRIHTQFLQEPAPTLDRPPSYSMQSPTPSIRLFEELYCAETFIRACMTPTSIPRFKARHPNFHRLVLCVIHEPRIWTDINTGSNVTQSQIHEDTTYSHCWLTIFKAILTFKFPVRASILINHLMAGGCMNPFTKLPFQLYTCLQHNEILPAREVITLASTVIIADRPPASNLDQWRQAAIDLVIHIFVILQIELTIRWNSITGLGGLANVGQLVPLIVGVGTLTLVVGRGVEGLLKGVRVWEVESRGDRRRREGLESFLGAYGEWKEIKSMR